VTAAAPFQAVVVGAGLNGLATAYHLRRLGLERILVLEQFRLGHDRGSSHGAARIMRSTYPDESYVRLVQAAREEEWPRLEQDCGRRLTIPVPGCFFGDGEEFERYVCAVERAGAAVESLSPTEARSRFPLLRLEGMGVLADHTAGIVSAAETMEWLECLLAREGGVEVREETAVTSIAPGTDPLVVETTAGPIATERVVVTAGPWAARLVPLLDPHLSVVRQTVTYLDIDAAPVAIRAPALPVWALLGDGPNSLYFGLPEFVTPGVKVGRHVTVAPATDPDIREDADPDAVEHLRAFAERTFRVAVRAVLATETCLYTCTPEEDFVLDLHPDDPRIAIGAGFSGHGFKFGPLTGRILAELVLTGETTVTAFENDRASWRIPG
jgi:sarcosine oxidase